MKWIGAAYLVYVGLMALFGKSKIMPAEDGTPTTIGGWRLFRDGFILQASNPKAIVFFTALLPQFINPQGSVVQQVLILAITSAIIEFFVLLGYGSAAGRASALAHRPRYATWTNRVAGVLLIGAGAGLAALRKT